jgi:hypothetical protein
MGTCVRAGGRATGEDEQVMQKLDELIEATLQDREREQLASLASDTARGKRLLVPYWVLSLVALCLLSVAILWACSGPGTW